MEFRLLNADEVDCKIKQINQYGVLLLLYKDARCDMNILDETVGAENWQRSHEVVNGNLFCNVGIHCENGWVWKQDVGTESMTEKEKGEASDSFKRACFNWGIGRELYTAPKMFVNPKDLKTHKQENGRWTCTDYFTVQDIQYIGRKICFVRIKNEKTNGYIDFGTPAGESIKQEEIAYKVISSEKAKALFETLVKMGTNIETLLDQYHVKSVYDLNEAQHSNIIQRINKYGNNGKN